MFFRRAHSPSLNSGSNLLFSSPFHFVNNEDVIKNVKRDVQKQALDAVSTKPTRIASMAPEKSKDFFLIPRTATMMGSKIDTDHLNGDREALSLSKSHDATASSPIVQKAIQPILFAMRI